MAASEHGQIGRNYNQLLYFGPATLIRKPPLRQALTVVRYYEYGTFISKFFNYRLLPNFLTGIYDLIALAVSGTWQLVQ